MLLWDYQQPRGELNKPGAKSKKTRNGHRSAPGLLPAPAARGGYLSAPIVSTSNDRGSMQLHGLEYASADEARVMEGILQENERLRRISTPGILQENERLRRISTPGRPSPSPQSVSWSPNTVVPISFVPPVLTQEDDQLRGLDYALREAALARNEGARQIQAMAQEFEQSFRPSDPARAPASSLIVKCCKLAQRMIAASSKLEYNAAAALNLSKIGTVERESIITALQQGLIGTDVGIDWVRQTMTQQMEQQREAHEIVMIEAQATLGLMQAEVAVSEVAIEEIRAFAREMGVKFADEKKRNVTHVADQMMRRLARLSLSRGWTTWHTEWEHGHYIRHVAVQRCRNASLNAGFRLWVQAYPPMTRLRRALEPYQRRIDDLEAALRREKQDKADVTAMLEAKLKDTGAEAARRKEMQHQQRVEHLQGIAIRKLLKAELARGWTNWYLLHEQRVENRKRAAARFRSVGLWKAFSRWVQVYPPTPSVTEAQQRLIDELEAELEAERAAHAATKEELAQGADHLEHRIREAHQGAAELRAYVAELQSVVREAYDANTWAASRKVLYHESLRYIPTAATHGRGNGSHTRGTPPQLRRSSVDLQTRVVENLQKAVADRKAAQVATGPDGSPAISKTAKLLGLGQLGVAAAAWSGSLRSS